MRDVLAAARLRSVPLLESSWRRWRNTGGNLYLVGGYLRDMIMGRCSSRAGIDIDLAATGDVLGAGRRLARELRAGFVVLDDEHLTVRLVKKAGEKRICLDIARLRADSIEADLKLRDFTINALAVDLEAVFSGSSHEVPVIDVTGGLPDLQARVLRQTGERTFPDDPLRTLRLFRLAAELKAAPEPGTVEQASAHAGSLKEISRERIRDELVKLLACRCSAEAVRRAETSGVLAAALGGLGPAAARRWGALVARYEQRRQDETAWPETVIRRMESYRAAPLVDDRPRRALVKLALLLGFSRAEDPWRSGRMAAREIRDFLALSRRESAALDRIITGAVFFGPGTGGGDAVLRDDLGCFLGTASEVEAGHPARRAVYRLYTIAGDELPGAVTAALTLLEQDLVRPGGVLLTDYWRENNRLRCAPKYLDGAALIKLGIPAGPRVGEAAAALQEAAAVGVVTSRDEARDWMARYLKDAVVRE